MQGDRRTGLQLSQGVVQISCTTLSAIGRGSRAVSRSAAAVMAVSAGGVAGLERRSSRDWHSRPPPLGCKNPSSCSHRKVFPGDNARDVDCPGRQLRKPSLEMIPATRDSNSDEVVCQVEFLPAKPIFDHCSSSCVIYVVGRGWPTREPAALCLEADRAICVSY